MPTLRPPPAPHASADIELDDAAIIAGNNLLRRSQLKITYYLLFVAAVFLGPSLLLWGLGSPAASKSLTMWPLQAILVVLYPFLVKWAATRRALQYFKSWPAAQRYHNVSWTEEGIHVSTPDSQALYRWESLKAWAEDATVFAFILPAPLYVAIPKNCLSDEQIISLRNCVETSSLKKAVLFPI